MDTHGLVPRKTWQHFLSAQLSRQQRFRLGWRTSRWIRRSEIALTSPSTMRQAMRLAEPRQRTVQAMHLRLLKPQLT